MTKEDRLAKRQQYLAGWPEAVAVFEASDGSAAYTFTTKTGKPGFLGFTRTRGKPTSYYSYGTEDQRNNAIFDFITRVKEDIAYTAAKKVRRMTMEVGQILVSSWGYDQTNIDYYLVTEVSKTGASVKLSEVGQSYLASEASGMGAKVEPDLTKLAPLEGWKRIGEYGVKIHNSSTARPWDGKPDHATWYH
jgi:hypothetical protein